MTSPWSPAAEGVGTNHPLPPPRRSNSYDESAVSDRSARWLAERIGAVMAIFFALVLAQRWLPRKRQSLPHGSVQVCGKVPLDSHQSIHLVRLGQRLLVLLESPQGMQCVAEITDPSEVRRLLEAEAPDSEIRAAVNVRQVLSTFRQRASFPA